MSIKIGQVKAWREDIDATHIVVFAIGRDGRQHVATHGETKQNAQEAAKAGNKLKGALGWPEDLCRAKPERLKHLKEEIKEIEEEILLGMQIEKEILHKCIPKTHPFTNL